MATYVAFCDCVLYLQYGTVLHYSKIINLFLVIVSFYSLRSTHTEHFNQPLTETEIRDVFSKVKMRSLIKQHLIKKIFVQIRMKH